MSLGQSSNPSNPKRHPQTTPMSTFLFLLTLFSTTNAYYIIPIRSKFHSYIPSRLHQTTPGLFADKNFKAGDNLLSIPYESTITSADSVYKDFELRTGNNGVLALEILDALHSSSVTTTNQFVKSLPPPLSPEMRKFPILWSERQQSVLQQSSTNKIYDILDDLEDDFNSIQSSALAPFVTEDEFKWALCIARSQSVFADGELYLSPLLQFANYGDEKEANEVTAGPKTIFGDSTQCWLLVVRTVCGHLFLHVYLWLHIQLSGERTSKY